MCGIAGIHRRGDVKIKTVDALADRLLMAIEHRGGDSTGLLTMTDNGTVKITKTTEQARTFIKNRARINRAARTVLLHTRFATQGAVIERNAHPVVAGKTAAIHNGMIYNDAALFAEYGMKRTAEVDSIVIPAIIEHFGWDKAEKAFGKLRGGAAVAIVNSDHPGDLILARTRSYPLHVLVTKDLVVWASERTAIEVAWQGTYGTRPKGEWLIMQEWSMLKVNGEVEEILLPIPKLANAPAQTWKKRPKQKATKTATEGRARKRKRKAGSNTMPARPVAPKPTVQLALPEVHEPFMDEAVKDLMRWANCDYEEAYEAVFGVSPPEDDSDAGIEHEGYEWMDDMLVPAGTARYRELRKAEGWEVGA